MKTLILVFLLSAFQTVAAATADDFIASYASDSELTHAEKAYSFCTNLFQLWPSAEYKITILGLGEAWKQNPDPAYYLLETCQDLWTAKYLDPVKTKEIPADLHARTAFLLSVADFLHGAPYLRQQIRLFGDTKPVTSAQLPMSPYEVLMQMASSEREMDQSIHETMRESYSMMVGLVGTLPFGVRILKDFSTVVGKGGLAAGRFVKQALIVWLAGEAISTGIDWGMWYKQESNIWAPVKDLMQTLKNKNKNIPQPVLVDQFYKASEYLGYFYNMDLYRADSGDDTQAKVNEACYPNLVAFFSAPDSAKPSYADVFAQGTFCQDAVMVWIGASQWLSQNFPGQSQVQQVSDRLMAKAKRAFQSYQESKAYEATLPVCAPSLQPETFLEMECHDPKDGSTII